MQNHFSPFHHRLQAEMKYPNQFSQSNARPAAPHSINRRETVTRKRKHLTCSRAESSFSSCRCLLCHTRKCRWQRLFSGVFLAEIIISAQFAAALSPVPFPCFCTISVTFIKGAFQAILEAIIAETTAQGISLLFRIQHRLLHSRLAFSVSVLKTI